MKNVAFSSFIAAVLMANPADAQRLRQMQEASMSIQFAESDVDPASLVRYGGGHYKFEPSGNVAEAPAFLYGDVIIPQNICLDKCYKKIKLHQCPINGAANCNGSEGHGDVCVGQSDLISACRFDEWDLEPNCGDYRPRGYDGQRPTAVFQAVDCKYYDEDRDNNGGYGGGGYGNRGRKLFWDEQLNEEPADKPAEEPAEVEEEPRHYFGGPSGPQQPPPPPQPPCSGTYCGGGGGYGHHKQAVVKPASRCNGKCYGVVPFDHCPVKSPRPCDGTEHIGDFCDGQNEGPGVCFGLGNVNNCEGDYGHGGGGHGPGHGTPHSGSRRDRRRLMPDGSGDYGGGGGYGGYGSSGKNILVRIDCDSSSHSGHNSHSSSSHKSHKSKSHKSRK